MSNQVLTPPPSFVGQYIKDMRDCIVAGQLAGCNVVLVGNKGTAKTEVTNRALKVITDDHYGTFNINPSSPIEKVIGFPDFNIALQKNEYVLNPKGSAYDPDFRSGNFDEGFRGNDPLYDSLLDAFERKDIPRDEAPYFVMTANFIAKSERVEPLHDRIGLICWVTVTSFDIKAIVKAQLEGIHGDLVLPDEDQMPTWDDVLATRAASPGPNAIKAIQDAIEMLDTEARAVEGGIFTPNPRRYRIWSHILFRVSYFYNGGDADFTKVHRKAMEALQWAWPTTSAQEAAKWKEIVLSSGDAAQAAINATLGEIYNDVKTITGEPIDRAMEFGKRAAGYERKFNDFLVDADPETVELVNEAKKKMKLVMQDLSRGIDPQERYIGGE